MRRSGLTLIETTLGVLLLGMIAATFAGTTGAVRRQAERDEDRLAAYELANRLLLQHLDDEDGLPTEGVPILYDGARFRWRAEAKRVDTECSRAATHVYGSTPVSLDFRRRLRVVTVSVGLADDPDGPALASLTRMFDPLTFRNADSIRRRVGNDELGFFRDIMRTFDPEPMGSAER